MRSPPGGGLVAGEAALDFLFSNDAMTRHPQTRLRPDLDDTATQDASSSWAACSPAQPPPQGRNERRLFLISKSPPRHWITSLSCRSLASLLMGPVFVLVGRSCLHVTAPKLRHKRRSGELLRESPRIRSALQALLFFYICCLLVGCASVLFWSPQTAVDHQEAGWATQPGRAVRRWTTGMGKPSVDPGLGLVLFESVGPATPSER